MIKPCFEFKHLQLAVSNHSSEYMIALCFYFLSWWFFQTSILLNWFVKLLSGKELARYLFRTRFQRLPLRTARDVFHQAAHLVVFFKRVMCPVELAATFMILYLARVMGVFSSPNITILHRIGIHYSISATQHSSFFCAYVAWAKCVPSLLDSLALH